MTIIAGRTTTPRPTTTSSTGFGASLLSLAVLLVLNTVLGPLVTGVVDYEISATVYNQLVGLEIVTVLLVAPVTAWAGVLALRGHPAAPLLAIGPAAYTTYMFVQYVLGPEYDSYSPTVLFQLGLVVLSGSLALWAWQLSGTGRQPVTSPRQRRIRGVLLLGFAGFVLLRYAGGLVGAWTGADIAEEFADDRTFYWSIFLLDLGAVVPFTVAAGLGALLDRPWADRAVPAVMGWFALVPPSVASMAVVMLARGDAHASVGTVVMLSVASVVFGAVAVWVFAPLFRRCR